MRYDRIEEGKFISRPNRFIANVCARGNITKAHVKNTGRLGELLVNDAVVYLQRHNSASRRTDLSLIGVRKGDQIVNIDSQSPNKVMHEWLAAGGLENLGKCHVIELDVPDASAFASVGIIYADDSESCSDSFDSQADDSESAADNTKSAHDELVIESSSQKLVQTAPGAFAETSSRKLIETDLGTIIDTAESIIEPGESVVSIKPEFTYGSSRIDFLVETTLKKILMEVKGVTLEKDGTALFPDAPTERGVRHIIELCCSIKDGYCPVIAFVIQMTGVSYFSPNAETHREFADALIYAHKQGVKIIALDCEVSCDTISIKNQIPVVLHSF